MATPDHAQACLSCSKMIVVTDDTTACSYCGTPIRRCPRCGVVRDALVHVQCTHCLAWLDTDDLVVTTHLSSAVEQPRDSEGSVVSWELEWHPIYIGGFEHIPPRRGGFLRQAWHWLWTVTFSDVGVKVSVAPSRSPEWPIVVASQDWHGLRGVFLEPSHSTLNPVALAGFGVLGIGSRLDWMIVDVQFGPDALFDTLQSSSEPHAVFMTRNTPQEVRLEAEVLAREVPITAGKFGMAEDFDDRTRMPAAANPDANSLVADLSRLAELKQAGALSEEEFADAKRKLLEDD